MGIWIGESHLKPRVQQLQCLENCALIAFWQPTETVMLGPLVAYLLMLVSL